MAHLFPTASPIHASQIIPASGTSTQPNEKRISRSVRRRNRLITSCLECRRRKLKCDKQQPCNNCAKFTTHCVYITQGLDPQAQAKLAEVKEKMGMLERTLEENLAQSDGTKQSSKSPPPISEAPPLPGQDAEHSDDDHEEEEDLKGLNPSDLGVQDITYHEDEENDDLVDLGISIGRLRITERIGGLVRPKFAEEMAHALQGLPEDDSANPFAGQSPSTWMEPGNEFVAPSSSFFFAPGVEKTSLMTYLPAKSLVDKLMANYWDVVHTISHIVHRPTFERQYAAFWQKVSSGFEPRMSFQAVLFAALLGSIISMPEDKVFAEFGVEKQPLVDNFQQGTEAALAKANFLRTTKLETLQAFVMYLIPLCRAEVSRAHSALAGTCIRLAECMGLHRDPAYYTKNPIEIQIRRLIWFHIAFLDIRTCESTGPRPQIRRDEYDTKFPLNVDDATLQQAVENGEQVTEDSNQFTDMTITRMRFECYEMHRVIWAERPKLGKPADKGGDKVTVTSLLSRVQAFKAAMEKMYLPMMSKSNPQHVVAMEMYNISSMRLYVAVLHPFASSDRHTMPERIRNIMLASCILIVEHSMNIEQQPALKKWSWYVGALHQYHVALLLTTELRVQEPDSERLQRMWRCIDYSFELPPDLSRMEKLRMVLKELSDRCGAYSTMRRMRGPTDMPSPGTLPPVRRVSSQNQQTSFSHIRSQSNSTQSSKSGITQQMNTSVQQQYQDQQQSPQPLQPPQIHSQQPYNQENLPIKGPLGAMPQTDWGSFDLVTATAPFAPGEDTTPYNFGNFIPNVPPTPTSDLLNATSARPPSERTNSVAANAMMGSSGTGASPMQAAINDIDWNEWEKLFGNAETGAGNLHIPPFTFPSFEPSDLQWPNQGGVM